MLGSIPAIVRKPAAYLFTIATPLIPNAPHGPNAGALRIAQQLTQAHDHVVHRALVQELEELMETGRQLRAAQQALLEERLKKKRGE